MFSNLICYSKISPNTYGKRTKIENIIPHCFVGSPSVEKGTNVFSGKGYKYSCNYYIDAEGNIGGVLPEEYASICSSNKKADMSSITIELACKVIYPYEMTQKTVDSLVKLCVDICKRHNIKALKWSEKKSDRINHIDGCNVGVHRDYAKKSCPGDWLYQRMGNVVDRVNNSMNNTSVTSNGLGIRKSAIGSINFDKLDYTYVFDWKYYRNKYADLSINGLKTQQDFEKHFKTRGLLEARQGNSLFNPIAYRNNNKDLNDLFGSDYEWYYAHYILAGRKEGRKCL